MKRSKIKFIKSLKSLKLSRYKNHTTKYKYVFLIIIIYGVSMGYL